MEFNATAYYPRKLIPTGICPDEVEVYYKPGMVEIIVNKAIVIRLTNNEYHALFSAMKNISKLRKKRRK